MPWNPAQTRLFLAAAHDPDIAKKHGIAPHKARELAMESSPEQRSNAMRKQRAQASALRRKP